MSELTLNQHKELWQLLADELNVKEVVLETPVFTDDGQMLVVYKADSSNFMYRFTHGSEKEPLSETTLLKVLENLRRDLLSNNE